LSDLNQLFVDIGPLNIVGFVVLLVALVLLATSKETVSVSQGVPYIIGSVPAIFICTRAAEDLLGAVMVDGEFLYFAFYAFYIPKTSAVFCIAHVLFMGVLEGRKMIPKKWQAYTSIGLLSLLLIAICQFALVLSLTKTNTGFPFTIER